MKMMKEKKNKKKMQKMMAKPSMPRGMGDMPMMNKKSNVLKHSH